MAHHVLQTGSANGSHHIVRSVVSSLVDSLRGSSLGAGSDDTRGVLLPSGSQDLHPSQSGDGPVMTTSDGVLQARSYARPLDENYARAWFDAHKQTSEVERLLRSNTKMNVDIENTVRVVYWKKFRSVYVSSTQLQESSYLQTISP
ncbi:hypothetical protein PAXINDRAFT_20503 [Paxillus involutus ATCC 200175]|uniref:Uncharacterized protein n=1 Tax=Paxillus involutus ATCC 200175 TaxID=664439 RepID=A0A0C9T4H7_PAXIN|nr:hypothetical protein PAXINDRAFT_20503 [Paxillus involutus ATCC 200175]